MPDTNRDGYIKLGYEIDQGSINAVNQATAAVETRLAGLQKSTAGIGEAAEKSGSRLKDAFSRSEGAIKADQKAVDDLRKSLTEAADEADKLNKSGSGAGSSFNVEGLRRTGGALSQLGAEGVGGAISRAGDLAQVAKEFEQIGTAGKGLTGVLSGVVGAIGPVGLALGAIAVGVKVFSDGLAAADAEIKKSSDQISQYYQIIKDGTTESIKAQIKKLEADKAINDVELKYRQDNLKAMQDQAHEAAQHYSTLDEGIKAFFKELGVELEQAGVRAGPLTEKIKELQQKSSDTQIQIDLYNKALGDTAVAANDAKAAEDELAKARLQGIEKNIKDEQQQAQLMRSGSSKQIEDMIAARQDEIKAIEDNLPALEEQAKKSKEGAAELEKYQKRLADLKKEQTDLTNNILPLVKAREGEKAWIDSITKGIDDRIKNEQKYADLVKNGSSKQVQDRIDAIEQEKQTLRESIDTFDELGKTNEDARKQADEYRKQLDKLGDEEGKLTSQVLPLIQAREAEAKAVEKQKAQAGIVEKLEDDKAKIVEKAEDDRKAIIQKGEEERASIIDRAAKARADLEDKYGQRLVEIARNAADEAAKALTDLQQKQADLRTSLGRDEEKASRDAADKTLDIQIKAQRAERDALQEHVARLEEIRRSDYAATQKDLLDRNFLSIYQRRLSQNEQIEQENTKFGADRGKRQQAINDEVQDAQRQAQIARRERLIAFQQQQDDANLAYQRQLVAAKQAHDKELQLAQEAHVRELAENRKKAAEDLADLQRKTAKELQARQAAETKELAARQAGAVKELQLLEKTEAQRLEIIAKYAKKANDLIANALKATPTKRAGGGYLEAGQASMVNEPESSGRESFNGVPLPGAGLFIPSQAGYVNPNGGGAGKSISNTNTFYIQAHDTEGVKREVISVLRQVMG